MRMTSLMWTLKLNPLLVIEMKNCIPYARSDVSISQVKSIVEWLGVDKLLAKVVSFLLRPSSPSCWISWWSSLAGLSCLSIEWLRH